VKTRHVQLQHRNFGEFKVPGLRNVALTAPYLHDGQVATLAGMVRHYSELDLDRLHADGERILDCTTLERARRLHQCRDRVVRISDPVRGGTGWGNWQPVMVGRNARLGLEAQDSFW